MQSESIKKSNSQLDLLQRQDAEQSEMAGSFVNHACTAPYVDAVWISTLD